MFGHYLKIARLAFKNRRLAMYPFLETSPKFCEENFRDAEPGGEFPPFGPDGRTPQDPVWETCWILFDPDVQF